MRITGIGELVDDSRLQIGGSPLVKGGGGRRSVSLSGRAKFVLLASYISVHFVLQDGNVMFNNDFLGSVFVYSKSELTSKKNNMNIKAK